MLGYLEKLKRPAGGRSVRSRTVPRGIRVYAIGDIHGRLDLLDDLLDRIDRDAAERPDKRRMRVFLGDYIDRGPRSAGVLERLAGIGESDEDAFFLLGNHEEAMLRILGGDVGLMSDWLRFGGRQCLESYGVDMETFETLPPDDQHAVVTDVVPARHMAFLEGCDDSVAIGDYLFVHAGIRPGAPLADQRQRDLRWIREPFLSCKDDHGAVIVHGHSISEDVDWNDNRIGIDTGAYASGVLTALVLSGARRRVLQASR